MAKKAKKKAAKATTKKKAERKPAARKRRVSLGLPAKSSKTVKAADAPEHQSPPADSAKPDAAGGDSYKHVGDGVFQVTITRTFTASETGACFNAAGETEGDEDQMGNALVEFMHKHVDDAVAEAEADTESEQPRYSTAPSDAPPASEAAPRKE